MNKISLSILVIFSILHFACSEENTWEELIKAGKNAYYSNRLDRAEGLYLQALEKAQEFPNNDENLAYTYFKLGMLYQYKGLFPKAVHYYKKSQALEKNPTSRAFATNLNNLAGIEIQQGNLQKGQQLLTKGLNVWEKRGDYNHPVAVTSLTLQGIIYRDEGKYSEANNYFQRAFDLSQTVKGVDKGYLFGHWGLLYEKQGKNEKAEKLYIEAITFHKTSYGPKNAELAKSLTFLGSLNIKQGKMDEAEANLKEAMEIQETIFGSAHPDLVVTLEGYGNLLRLRGKEDEAVAGENRIRLIRSSLKQQAQNFIDPIEKAPKQ